MTEQDTGATNCLHSVLKKNNCICVHCCQLVTSVVRNNLGHNFKSCSLMVKQYHIFPMLGNFPEKYFSGKITSLQATICVRSVSMTISIFGKQ